MIQEPSLKAGCIPRLLDGLYLLSFKMINRGNTKRSPFSYLLSCCLRKITTAWKRLTTKPCCLIKSPSFYIFGLIWTQTDPFPTPLCIARFAEKISNIDVDLSIFRVTGSKERGESMITFVLQTCSTPGWSEL